MLFSFLHVFLLYVHASTIGLSDAAIINKFPLVNDEANDKESLLSGKMFQRTERQVQTEIWLEGQGTERQIDKRRRRTKTERKYKRGGPTSD